jgi:hypothetical protein
MSRVTRFKKMHFLPAKLRCIAFVRGNGVRRDERNPPQAWGGEGLQSAGYQAVNGDRATISPRMKSGRG